MSVSVSEAVRSRISVRAYLPKPVPRDIVVEILDAARRAPSASNLQPWQVHVLGGAVLDDFRALIAARRAAGVKERMQYEMSPPDLWEPYRGYRYKVGEDLYATIKVGREDRAGRLQQFARNFAFFGAPVGLFFTLDRRFGPPQWADMGMFMQTIMLLAVERGLGTCAQGCWAYWPDTVAEFLRLDANTILLSGMALGYPDEAAPINQLRTERAALSDFCQIHGL